MWDIAKVLEHYGCDGVPEGRNRPLRCPFHDDRTASASVDTDKGLFLCHTCGVAGDAISLIQIQEGVGYLDAVSRAEKITGDSHSPVSNGPSSKPRSSLLPGWARDYNGDSGTLPSWLRSKSD